MPIKCQLLDSCARSDFSVERREAERGRLSRKPIDHQVPEVEWKRVKAMFEELSEISERLSTREGLMEIDGNTTAVMTRC